MTSSEQPLTLRQHHIKIINSVNVSSLALHNRTFVSTGSADWENEPTKSVRAVTYTLFLVDHSSIGGSIQWQYLRNFAKRKVPIEHDFSTASVRRQFNVQLHLSHPYSKPILLSCLRPYI